MVQHARRVNASVRLPIRRKRAATRQRAHLPPRIPSCSSRPSWFPLFFTTNVTRPQVARPRSPARRADSPLPMNELPDVAFAPATSRKVQTEGERPDARRTSREKDSTSADGRGTIHYSSVECGTPLPNEHRGRRTTAVHRNGRIRDF